MTEQMNAYEVAGRLTAASPVVSLARIAPRALEAALAALAGADARPCGHPGPWFGKPGDLLLRCPACMYRSATYTRWTTEPRCTDCGGDASDADVWLFPLTDDLLVVLRLCGACRMDVAPLDLETEIRK